MHHSCHCTAVALALLLVTVLCGPACSAVGQVVNVTGIDVRLDGVDQRTGLPRIQVTAWTPANALNRSEPFCFDGFGIWAARAACRAAGYATAGSVIEADAIGSAVPLNWWVDCPINATTISADACTFRVRSNGSCTSYRANVICDVEDVFAFEWCPVAPPQTTAAPTSTPLVTAIASNASLSPAPPLPTVQTDCTHGVIQMRPAYESRLHAAVRASVCGDTVGYYEARALCNGAGFERGSVDWGTRRRASDGAEVAWPDAIDCNPGSTRNVLDDCRVWVYSSRLGGTSRCRSLAWLNCRAESFLYFSRTLDASWPDWLTVLLVVGVFLAVFALIRERLAAMCVRRHALPDDAANDDDEEVELPFVQRGMHAGLVEDPETATADTGAPPAQPLQDAAVPNPLNDPDL